MVMRCNDNVDLSCEGSMTKQETVRLVIEGECTEKISFSTSETLFSTFQLCISKSFIAYY